MYDPVRIAAGGNLVAVTPSLAVPYPAAALVRLLQPPMMLPLVLIVSMVTLIMIFNYTTKVP